MQVRWIEDFLTLADMQGFARAAAHRHVSQPTFSRHIQSLEQWLGVELVDRRGARAHLTPAGRMFREFAIDMLRRTYDMRSFLRGQAAPPEATLRFAVAHTLSVTFFPQWLNELKAVVGEVHAHVNAVNFGEGARALAEGATDLLLVYHHPQLPALLDPQRFPHVTLSSERMAPYSVALPGGGARFRLPGPASAPVPFLSYSAGSYLAQVVEMILLGSGTAAHLARSFDTHMAEALKAMILAGHGVGWLPQSCAAREAREGRLVLAGSARWACQLEVRLYRRTDLVNEAVERIWQRCAT